MRDLGSVIGTWGLAPHPVAHVALAAGIALGLAALVPRVRTLLVARLGALSAKRFGWGIAFAAALLSLLYVAEVLRGGPRIVDATTYLLEARTFAAGHLTFDAGLPSAETRGRFLVYDAGTNQLGGLFPPGYPAVLALFVALGQPLLLGPVLGAAIALATHRLVRRIAGELGEGEERAELAGRFAAIFSATCAVLRYHTADTMSHGLSALYVCLAFVFSLRARDSGATVVPRIVVGLALGGLVATRPVSAFAPAIAATYLLVADERRPRAVARLLAPVALAIVPGLLVLLAYHAAVGGSVLASPQRVYYATSDGPPGCFRFGFGAGIGCLFEHGDFVRHNLPHGYGFVAALGTTGRRLKMHLADAANVEPLVLLVVAGAIVGRRARSVRAIAIAVAAQIVAYAPFYFDGNFPGGGARFFADVLPLEHALLVVALLRAGSASTDGFATRALAALAVSLVGFAIHGAHQHLALADREDKVPFFLPDALARADVDRGLLFVETDHAFSLAFDPAARVENGVRVARLRGDDHDWLLFLSLGRPPTYRYRATATPEVAPFAPDVPDGNSLRFEAEAEWPPLAQEGGYAIPVWRTSDASGGRVLLLTPTSAVARATIAVPALAEENVDLVARVVAPVGARGTIRIAGAEVSFEGTGAITELLPLRVHLFRGESPLTLEARGGEVALDRVTLTPAAGEIRLNIGPLTPPRP